MIEQQLKTAVMQIHMPASAQKRLVELLSAHLREEKRRSIPMRRKIAAAAIAACLVVSLSLPALAAIAPVYDLMYAFSPAVAQLFQPVQVVDESNGIEMEVVSVYLHGDTAEIFITMQDLIANRLDATTDLHDSYSIRSPFDASAHCEMVEYEEEKKRASFLITVSRTDGGRLEYQKITFSVNELLAQRSETTGAEIISDLSAIDSAKEMQRVYWIGGGGLDFDSSIELFPALVPEPAERLLPDSGIALTGAAFIGEDLHVQIAVEDPLQKDNHAELYLVDASGNRTDCNFSFTFTEDSDGIRTDYTEYVFSKAPKELSEYALYGDFWISGTRIEGDWQVTFSLNQTA